jgi:hypothetical protein
MDDNDWEDDDDDYEGDYDEDFNEDEPSAWYECPACGAEVYDDANVCPACDEYITPKLVTRSDLRPMWYIFLGMAGILAVVLVLSGLISLIG